MKQLHASKLKSGSGDTRSRLIEAATAVFAERGYQTATTREICVRARANAAAVNYHFGDKLGLYKAALKSLIGRQEARLEERTLSAMPAERALRRFIQAMFENLNDRDGEDRYTRLMVHELSEPTPGLALVVDQIIAPRARLLSAIVARLTSDSARSLRTRLAAHSIMAQVVHYMHARPVIKILWPGWRMTPAARRQIIDHVIDFSLAGLRAGAGAQRRQRVNRGATSRGRRK